MIVDVKKLRSANVLDKLQVKHNLEINAVNQVSKNFVSVPNSNRNLV